MHKEVPDYDVDSARDLPPTCDLRSFGLDPLGICRVTVLGTEHDHSLYRIAYGTQSYVLKWFEEPAPSTEVRAYQLLQRHGVPMLPIYALTDKGLLLEDLETSRQWRLATPDDIEATETGTVVASWYKALHSVGAVILRDTPRECEFLGREVDALTPDSILVMGKKLNLVSDPVWALAAHYVGNLRLVARSMPETITYNDFHWSNLALSRVLENPLRAIVFDYHLLGIGMRYSDCRNVVGSLGPKARAAFWDAYGVVDEREVIIDKPLATLYTLQVACERASFPRWAEESLAKIQNGELEADLRRAIEAFGL